MRFYTLRWANQREASPIMGGRAGINGEVIAGEVMLTGITVIAVCLYLVFGWGPKVKGELPDGGYVAFRSRTCSCLRETVDVLIWVKPDGTKKDFIVDQIHAGFAYVVLKLTEDGDGVWVEEPIGTVGASLDLASGGFRGKWDKKHEWARYGTGKLIGEGKTYRDLPIDLLFVALLALLAILISVLWLLRSLVKRCRLKLSETEEEEAECPATR